MPWAKLESITSLQGSKIASNFEKRTLRVGYGEANLLDMVKNDEHKLRFTLCFNVAENEGDDLVKVILVLLPQTEDATLDTTAR